MNEELKIIISAVTTELQKSVKEAVKELNNMKKVTDAASEETTGFSKVSENQGKELKELKTKYIDVVAAEGENSDSAKALAKQIQELSSAYYENQQKAKNLSSMADALDNSLFDVEKAAADTEKQLKELEKQFKEAEEKQKKTTEEFKTGFSKVGDAAKTGLKVAATAITAVGTALFALGTSTKEYREGQAKLDSAFETAGSSAKQAGKTYNDLYRVMGDSDTAVEAANHLAKLTTNEQDLAQWTNICQGIYATFGDSLPIEGLTEAANETARVGQVTGPLADALNWAGVSEDAFNEKLAACTTTQEREALIRETLNGLYDDASKKYEENAADVLAQNEAQAKLNEATAKLGEVMAPIQTMLAEFANKTLSQLTPHIQEFAETYGPQIQEVLGKIGEAISKVINWIADNWELISTLAIIITAISVALGVFSAVMGIVNAVMMASPVTWIILGIVAALAAVVAIIVIVIKYWDEIKAATKKCWDKIKEIISTAIDAIVDFFKKIIGWVKENWQGLLLFIVNPFAGAFKLVYDNCEVFRNFIDNFIEKIKSVISSGFSSIKDKIISPIREAFNSVRQVFSNLVSTIGEKLEAAKEKVRSVIEAIKGFFNFDFKWPKIKMPKFSITPDGWKIGDLLKGSIPKLSINWYAQGGVFEQPTLFSYGGNNIGGLGEAGAEAIVPLENNTKWLDKIAEKLSSSSQKQIILQVDGTTFAKIACDSINDLARQQGSLPLAFV